MVIRGNSRGNARQLSHYLLAQKDNEAIRILDVGGQDNAKAAELHRAIYLMGVSAELSKSDKGLYHAQINPAIGEDTAMQDDHWLQAADILGRQLGLMNQSRAIVLHTKKGRTHAHVVWERFDHGKQRMVSDSFSRLAQDRARKEMEAVFAQKPTPHRNKHRPELKASLSALWYSTGTGAQFVKAARKNGYVISTGSGRSPFMVVDENGRSYDLTRQLQGVKLKEVRQRLRHESLLDEKEAIALMRKNNNGNQEQGGDAGKQTTAPKPQRTLLNEFMQSRNDITTNNKPNTDTKPTHKTMQEEFAQNQHDMTANDNKPQQPVNNTRQQFKDNKPDTTKQARDKSVKEQFAENKADNKTEQQKDKERRREEFKQRMRLHNDNQRSRKPGLDIE